MDIVTILLAFLVGAMIVYILQLDNRLKALETKKDPYEKYRGVDGLLKRKVDK